MHRFFRMGGRRICLRCKCVEISNYAIDAHSEEIVNLSLFRFVRVIDGRPSYMASVTRPKCVAVPFKIARADTPDPAPLDSVFMELD